MKTSKISGGLFSTFEGFLNAFSHARCVSCRVEVDRVGFCRTCFGALRSSPGSSEITTFYRYAGPVRRAMRRAKFAQHQAAVSTLRCLFKEALEGEIANDLGRYQDIDLVTFVPSPFLRRAARGFDLSALFACAASSLLQTSVRSLLHAKHRPALSKSADLYEREREIKNAFVVKKGVSLEGAKVLIVDDVRTSGATFDEVFRVLYDAGCAKVIGCAFAQTPKRF